MDDAKNKIYLQRVMSGCIYGLAFSLPISIAVSSIFYFSLLGIYLLAGVWTFRLWPPAWGSIEKAFMVFWCISLLSGFFGVSPAHSLLSLGDDLYFLLVLLLGALLSTELKRRRAFQYFIAGAIATALLGVIQFAIGVDQSDNSGGIFLQLPRTLEGWPRPILDHLSLINGRVAGTRSHPITYAEGLLAPLAYTLSHVMLSYGNVISGVVGSWLLSVALLLSKSRGAWLAVVTMALPLLLLLPVRMVLRRGWVLLLPVALIFLLPSLRSRAGSIANPNHVHNVERLRMWQAGGQMIKDHPFLGIGPGNMRRISQRYQDPVDLAGGPWGHLHNTFIHMAAERGLLAVFAFGWLLILLAKTFIQSFRTGFQNAGGMRVASMTGLLALAAFIVSGFTESNYNDTEILMTFYFTMGVVLSWVRKPKTLTSFTARRGLNIATSKRC